MPCDSAQPRVPLDAPKVDIRNHWDPKKVIAVFDPEAQCEPSELLYRFCFLEWDQRWIQMNSLELDHHALHEDHPNRPGQKRMKMEQWPFVSLNVPRPTNRHLKNDFFLAYPVTAILEKPREEWDGSNIGGVSPGTQKQNKFKHWQLWIGTKNAAKSWNLLKDCRIKTICNTMEYEIYPHWKGPKGFEYTTIDVNHAIVSIFEETLNIVDFIEDLKQIDVFLRKGNVMIHCNRCQNRTGILAIGFVMAKTKSSFRVAYDYVQRLRPSICVDGNIPGTSKSGREFLELYNDEIKDCMSQTFPLPAVVSDQEWNSIVLGQTDWLGPKRLQELGLTYEDSQDWCKWSARDSRRAERNRVPVRIDSKTVAALGLDGPQGPVKAVFDRATGASSSNPPPGPPPVVADLDDRMDTSGGGGESGSTKRATLVDADSALRNVLEMLQDRSEQAIPVTPESLQTLLSTSAEGNPNLTRLLNFLTDATVNLSQEVRDLRRRGASRSRSRTRDQETAGSAQDTQDDQNDADDVDFGDDADAQTQHNPAGQLPGGAGADSVPLNALFKNHDPALYTSGQVQGMALRYMSYLAGRRSVARDQAMDQMIANRALSRIAKIADASGSYYYY